MTHPFTYTDSSMYMYPLYLLIRCVVMVGLPYPNLKSPELVEKMEYLNKTQVDVLSKQFSVFFYMNLSDIPSLVVLMVSYQDNSITRTFV